MKRFEQKTNKRISLESFLEFSVWRMYFKLARLEAWRSISDQFQTEMIGQRLSQGDGHGEKEFQSTDTWGGRIYRHSDGVDVRE